MDDDFIQNQRIVKERREGEETQEWYVDVAYQFADEMIKQSKVVKND